MNHPTHDLIVTTINDDQIQITTTRPGVDAMGVAQELAHRLRGDAALWGEPHDGCAVVIPARSISHVEVVSRPDHVERKEDTAVDAPAEAPPFDPDPPSRAGESGPAEATTDPVAAA